MDGGRDIIRDGFEDESIVFYKRVAPIRLDVEDTDHLFPVAQRDAELCAGILGRER